MTQDKILIYKFVCITDDFILRINSYCEKLVTVYSKGFIDIVDTIEFACL